jgi:hypothetical protein
MLAKIADLQFELEGRDYEPRMSDRELRRRYGIV